VIGLVDMTVSLGVNQALLALSDHAILALYSD
jgi:hypothetical protein